MTEKRKRLVIARLEQRLANICQTVPPKIPGPCYWLHEDAAESFCRKHAIQAHGRKFDLGAPLADSRFYERDEWEDAFFEGIGASDDSESDHSEACARCGETLSYVLTDSGVEMEIEYYREAPLIMIRDEDSYALDRLALNVFEGSPRKIVLGVSMVVNQAFRLLEEFQKKESN